MPAPTADDVRRTARANAERFRRAAVKHETKADELRRRADRLEAEHDRWVLERHRPEAS